MEDPKRTVVAGLTSGVLYVAGASVVFYRADVLSALATFAAIAVSTLFLAWLRFRPVSVFLVWAGAVGFLAAAFASLGPVEWTAGDVFAVALGAIWFGSIAAGPWLVATAALRHFLATSEARGRYNLDDLHS